MSIRDCVINSVSKLLIVSVCKKNDDIPDILSAIFSFKARKSYTGYELSVTSNRIEE